MGFFGKLFSIPVKIVNVPFVVIEKLVEDDDEILSSPLKALSDAIEEIDD